MTGTSIRLAAALAVAVPVLAGGASRLEKIVQSPAPAARLSSDAEDLRSRLEIEVKRVIQAGHLMPFRVQYGEGKPRHVYVEPWMMMFTLARAYPHLTGDLQPRTRDYLRREARLHPPWSRTALGPAGAYRQGDPAGVPEVGLPPRYRPTGTMCYAVWLYGHHTGDWILAREGWTQLLNVYSEIAREPPTYEHISGAIGMCRTARALGDEPRARQFEADAIRCMLAGTDFEAFRRNAHTAYSSKPDWFRGSDGIAFALFYLTPEVAEYLSGETSLRRAADRYAERSAAVWPLWWMAQAPVGDWGYFDEGSCAGPETRMMLFNYAAWVWKKPAKELRMMVDVPDALTGDCFYLQNLVTTLEVFRENG